MTTYYCTHCSIPILAPKPHQVTVFNKNGKIFCQPSHGYAHRTLTQKPREKKQLPEAPCTTCQKPADLSGHRHSQWLKTGRAYCSVACSKVYRGKISSETMARTNRQYASDRMKSRNPMGNPETVAKMVNSMKAAGHRPKIQGGNGREPSAAESVLWAMFGGLGFVMQPAIRTGAKPVKGGLSTHYKPDLGNWDLKLALEADGASHMGKLGKARDAKKEAFLTGIGWTVLRFSNEKILTRPDEVFATVMSTISRLTVSTPT